MKESVNVLGTQYKIELRKNTEDKLFDKLSCNGYCNEQLRLIVVGDVHSFKEYEDMAEEMMEIETKQILRHEIVHAFLRESGLCNCAVSCGASWATNEEMVDWISLQGPKIYEAWKEVGAI